MTFIQILGFLLLTSPLWGVTLFMIWESGWEVALKVWGMMAAIAAVVVGGIWLIEVGGR